LENLNDPRSRNALARNTDLLENYPMSFRRYNFFCLLFVTIGACPAVAADDTHPAVKPPALADTTKPSLKASKNVDKTKTKTTKTTKPLVPADAMRDVTFSDPGAPLVGSAKSPKPVALPSTAKGAPIDPDGGLSLALKWHATSDSNDPYDGTARHTSGPDGPGNAVLGGIKLGF
jgi:hypothetical protein